MLSARICVIETRPVGARSFRRRELSSPRKNLKHTNRDTLYNVPGRGHGKDVGLAVESRDQTFSAFLLQDGSELGAVGRHLADRAVPVDVGDQPAVTIAAHHVVDLERLTVAFDNPAAHYDPEWAGLLASHLQLLSIVAV